MKFRLRVRLKRSNDREEFEFDRAKSKNNIAENSFALGHETHNKSKFLQTIPLHCEVFSLNETNEHTLRNVRSLQGVMS